MRKPTLALLLLALILISSCTVAIKGLARLAVKDYNDYLDVNISNLQLTDSKGQQSSFSQLFKGKVVYLNTWNGKMKNRPYKDNQKYQQLMQRFSKYPDVVFVNLCIRDCIDTSSNAYHLTGRSPEFLHSVYPGSEDATPFIIGKDGTLLSFKGPAPTDDLLVDYVLYESRKGISGGKSAKRLIKGINNNSGFKKKDLREWYIQHFNKEPKNLSFSVSSPK